MEAEERAADEADDEKYDDDKYKGVGITGDPMEN